MMGLFFLLWLLAFPENSKALNQSSILMEQKTGRILSGSNMYALRHPASLTKKMTLYLLFEALKLRKVSLKTPFTVSRYASIQAPSKLSLKVGEKILVDDCIKALITKSANDIAMVVAEGLSGTAHSFVKQMNKKAKKLGMVSTVFYNPSGLPHKKQVTTAFDMVMLSRALYHDFPTYYHYFRTKYFCYKGRYYHNHNRMLGVFKGLDGIKTGFTQLSGFNISTSAVRIDSKGKPHRIFAVVMGEKTAQNRNKKAAKILEEGFKKLGFAQPRNFITEKPFLRLTKFIKKNKTLQLRKKPLIQKQRKARKIKRVYR